MGHTAADACIVAAIAAAFVVWVYFRHVERQRRLELLHQERVAAMEKGIPLPELEAAPRRGPDPRAPLMHGIAWTALGVGGVASLLIMGPLPNGQVVWPTPLPVAFLGIGLVLYYFLASGRAR